MNFRHSLRPAIVTVLVTALGFAVFSLHPPQDASTARTFEASQVQTSPDVQQFTTGDNYTLAPVTLDVPGSKTPDYGKLRVKAIAYAQRQIVAQYAAADVQFTVDQQAAKKAAVKQAKQAAKKAAKDPTKKVAKTALVAPAKAAVKPSVEQWTCLNNLWTGESGWQVYAVNADSGAYGIPQSLPAGKMVSEGSNWQTSYVTQINWGLKYIAGHYGTPCKAWDQWQARIPHWY